MKPHSQQEQKQRTFEHFCKQILKNERNDYHRKIKQQREHEVLFSELSPKTLEQFAEACGRDRAASVSREISKLHNTTVNGTLGELVEYFGQNLPRGEIVIVIGAQESAGPKVHKNKYKRRIKIHTSTTKFMKKIATLAVIATAILSSCNGGKLRRSRSSERTTQRRPSLRHSPLKTVFSCL